MTSSIHDRVAGLESALAELGDIDDCVVLNRSTTTSSEADPQSTSWTVAYVAPVPDAAPEVVKQRVADCLVDRGRNVAITLVRRIPLRLDGEPDLDALLALPVVTETVLREYSDAVSEHGVKVELHPVSAVARTVRIIDADAPVQPSAATGLRTRAHDEAAVVACGPKTRMSLAEGPALDVLPTDPPTVTQAILESAQRFPDLGVRAVSRDGDFFISYPDLLHQGRKVLGGLRDRGLGPGSYAILLVPTLAEYFRAAWACLLGGVVGVTVSSPPSFDAPSPVLDKLVHAWRALGRPVIITDDQNAAVTSCLRELYGEPEIASVTVSALEASAPSEDVYPARPAETAIFTLSSGSTGQSKVIPVTHRAIVENAISSRGVGLVRPGEASFNWLPFDHVAPQVMYLLRDVVLGCQSVHAPTSYIVEAPLRWLDVLEKYQINHTWSANFGYRLVTDALRAAPDRRWDLSHVRTMLNAGEQCTPPVIRDFLARTEAFGIGVDTIVHMWGMAETATGATCKFFARPHSVRRILKSTLGGRLREAEPGVADEDCVELMSMGPAAPGALLRVADDNHQVLPEGMIGRFQVKATRVTPGYLDNPEANREAFTPDGWFETGDLAFIMDGEVVITGRSKELIVINGEKYYCHEIEDVCGRLDGVRSGLVAACGVPDPVRGSEVLAIFFVPENESGGLPVEVIERVRSAVAARLRLTAAYVLPISEEQFPRTTSGKIQRAALVRAMAAGEFGALVAEVDAARENGADLPDCVFTPAWQPGRPRPGAAPTSTGVTLVFRDDLGLDSAYGHGETISVTPGDGFARVPGGYRIDPAAPDGWNSLRDDLAGRGIRPSTLLYLWSYLGTPDPAGDRSGVYDAVARCGQYLAACCRTFLPATTEAPELVAVTRQLYRVTGEERVCYPAAQTASVAGTLARERPDVRVRHIDLPGKSIEDDASTLMRAYRDAGAQSTSTAWRGGRPYRRAIKPVAEVASGRDPLRRGGRYLVSGGSGGVGAEILAGLADRYGARLVVIGRRPLESDPALRSAWERLDTAGRDVRYQVADVVDAEAVRAVVTEAEQRWGNGLDGIIHLADAYRFRPIAAEDPADWEPARLAKVSGTLNLLDIVRSRPGARLIVFSSLLGSLPFANCAAYGAGNAFADALVENIVAAGRTQATSLAWGLWHGIGINHDNPYEAAATRRGVLSLSADQGRVLARLVLRQPPGVYHIGLDPTGPQVRGMVLADDAMCLERVVLVGDAGVEPAELPELIDPFGTPVRFVVAERSDEAGQMALTDEEDEVLGVIRAILAPLVPVPIQPERNIHEYGITSIHMLQIHAQLEDALDIDIPKSALFVQPTIGALVSYLAARV